MNVATTDLVACLERCPPRFEITSMSLIHGRFGQTKMPTQPPYVCPRFCTTLPVLKYFRTTDLYMLGTGCRDPASAVGGHHRGTNSAVISMQCPLSWGWWESQWEACENEGQRGACAENYEGLSRAHGEGRGPITKDGVRTPRRSSQWSFLLVLDGTHCPILSLFHKRLLLWWEGSKHRSV